MSVATPATSDMANPKHESAALEDRNSLIVLPPPTSDQLPGCVQELARNLRPMLVDATFRLRQPLRGVTRVEGQRSSGGTTSGRESRKSSLAPTSKTPPLVDAAWRSNGLRIDCGLNDSKSPGGGVRGDDDVAPFGTKILPEKWEEPVENLQLPSGALPETDIAVIVAAGEAVHRREHRQGFPPDEGHKGHMAHEVFEELT